MRYSAVGRGINREINFSHHNSLIDNESLDRSNQRHVTFRQVNKLTRQSIQPTNKPKYHFTYGQPNNQSIGQLQNSDTKIQGKQLPLKENITEHDFNRKMNEKIYQFMSPAKERSRSLLIKKKKLKIFPDKYKPNNQEFPKENKQKKQQEIEEIEDLKIQIQRLKQQIKSLSLTLSKNSSRELTESVYKNESDRTQRLSELNSFNEKLYNQLAQKLKLISIEEYENYLQRSHQNKKFMQSVFSSSEKVQKPSQTFYYSKGIPQNFIDINDFQKVYQQKNKQRSASPNKNLNFENMNNQLVYPSKKQIQSPFLLNDNTLEGQKLKKIVNNQGKMKQRNESFTFHKQKRHFNAKAFEQKSNRLATNLPFNRQNAEQNVKKTKLDQIKIINQKKIVQWKFFDIQRHGKQKKQIHDFNQELENKILKKRSASEYVYMNRNRKH